MFAREGVCPVNSWSLIGFFYGRNSMSKHDWESFASDYSRVKQPHWFMLLAIGAQYIIIFLPAILVPLISLLRLHVANNSIGFAVIGFACISSAISTLIMRSNGWVGGNCFLPATYSAPLFAVSVLAMQSGSMAVVLGIGIMVGVLQIAFTPLLFLLRRIYNVHMAGFITLILGIWVGQTGIIALLFPDQISPILFHSKSIDLTHADMHQALIGLFALAIMLVLRLRGKASQQVLCILYGSLIAWVLAASIGMLDSRVIGLVKSAPWWQLLSYHNWVKPVFDFHYLLPCAIAALVIMFHVLSMVVTAQHAADYQKVNPNKKKKKRRRAMTGNLAAGIGLIFTSLLGAPQSPNVAGYGAQISTGWFVKGATWVFAAILIVLAYSPKLLLIFMTIPASVRGATLLFVGSGMFMYGLQTMRVPQMNTFSSVALALAFLIGGGFSIVPEVYDSSHLWIAGVTNPMGFFAIAIYVILHFVFQRWSQEA